MVSWGSVANYNLVVAMTIRVAKVTNVDASNGFLDGQSCFIQSIDANF